MRDWWIWSSDDLITWAKEAVLQPQDTPAPRAAWTECWATDAATRNGSYYFYLSIGPDQVAVMRAPTPKGPWSDPLGKPMLPASLGASLVPPTTIRDPCAFTDEDGSTYIVFGVFVYYIAKLGDDMISLAEAPVLINITNPLGPYGAKTDDKPFLHRANGKYYLSWGCFYAIGATPYGPFDYTGSVISTDAIDPAFRMNDSSTGPWYGHQDYADRHGSFWHNGAGQWYFASNDRSHSIDSKHPDVFRDTVIGYVHYLDNGTIAPVRIDATGVGSYDARGVIEAEDFTTLAGDGAHKCHDSQGRFAVCGAGTRASLTLEFPNVRGIASQAALVFRVANAGTGAASITARARRIGGVRNGNVRSHRHARETTSSLCVVAVPPTGDWDAFVDVRCTLTAPVPRNIDLIVTLNASESSGEDEAGNSPSAAGTRQVALDSFRFERL